MAPAPSAQSLRALPVWRETPLFTARERATAEFSEQELAELSWLIAVINTWNRLGAAARPWPLD